MKETVKCGTCPASTEVDSDAEPGREIDTRYRLTCPVIMEDLAAHGPLENRDCPDLGRKAQATLKRLRASER